MKDNRLTDGSLALSGKQHRVITIEAAERPQEIKLRVAAYARVSTASDDQLNSFAAQNSYYTTLISGKENWSLVDIYADEGITGISAEKRGDFQRMLSDCRRGKIDRVLVKSVSRFARNTKECLEVIRELKTLGIGVFFEEQNIDTGTMSGEMLTAMFAALAQAESQSISGNMRWSIQQRMKSGKFNTCYAPYGYRLVDGQLQIVPSEAENVRKIFEDYLKGKTSRAITKELNQTDSRSRPWHREMVEYILKNERYAGNALLQKRYRTDSFPPVSKRNKGERELYFVANSNPPIISQEIFDQAQKLRESRAASRPFVKRAFSEKIKCGCCGATFRAKPQKNTMYWVCRTHEEEIEKCPITQIPESEIQEAFLRLYYKLKHSLDYILIPMLNDLQTIRERRMLWSLDVIELNKRISNLSSQNQMLAELKKQGLIDPDIFISRTNELAEKLRTAKLEKERIIGTAEDECLSQTRELVDILDAAPDFPKSFDAELFGELIDKIIVVSNECLRFRLKNGLELEEAIERTVR